MKTEIYVISGFLGAGKTTLIQKLLKEAFSGKKVALVENDFGEISVDSALLKSGGIEVKEINSGCICCSLSGDFVKSLEELLERYSPDTVIIEPSGVGKLSDIVSVLSDRRISEKALLKMKITVADVKRCKMYIDNFGEFFEDQIKHADTVLLSRTQMFPDRIEGAVKLIQGLNERAAIFTSAWDKLFAIDILNLKKEKVSNIHSHSCRCACGKIHTHGEDCAHEHTAEDKFDTVTIHTRRTYTSEDIKTKIRKMEKSAGGTILRAKGIVRGTSGYLNVQYIPGNLQVTGCETSGDMLCIIGTGLDRKALSSIFEGE